MQPRKAVITIAFLLVLISACSLNPAPSGVETQPPVDDSEPPDVNPTPSATHTLTLTPEPEIPIISASMDTNCRIGQGSGFEYVGALLAGETAEVVAVEPDGLYYYIQNPDGPGYCWVWGEYLTVSGDTSMLPVYTRMPTYTPTPLMTFSAVYKNVEQCVSWYNIELTVTNSGAVPWESYELNITNTSLGTSDLLADDQFADCEACGCSYVDQSILPGLSGTLGSRPFMDHYPHGESFHAELTLCTGNGLTGECRTEVLDFTVP